MRSPIRRFAYLLLIVFLLSGTACSQTPAFLATQDLGLGGGDGSDPTPLPTSTVQVITTSGAIIIAGSTQTSATATPVRTPRPPLLYYAQSGDTLEALASRFGVSLEEINSPDALPPGGLINPEQLLIIPDVLDDIVTSESLLPDSEIVYSPSTTGFDIEVFVRDAGGYLATYREYLDDGWNSGAQVVDRVAMENSFNPRLLLALLEYQAGWVYGQPQNIAQTNYPMGQIELARKGLYKQLTWASRQLTLGYYGWRSGSTIMMKFKNGGTQRIAPRLNAGSAALQYLFAELYEAPRWPGSLYGEGSFIALHARMFGDPWLRAQNVEPLFPAFTLQPELELPFGEGRSWALTGGPHPSWGSESVTGAIDLAPSGDNPGCEVSNDWVTAPAAGLVVRTAAGLVVLDLDGDGREQTGWVLILMHVSYKDRVSAGQFVAKDDRIGHPSCEGGRATGSHVHIARKFNGEWIPVEGPLPFVLSGWTAHIGNAAYEGSMSKDGIVVEASVNASYKNIITRPFAP